MKCGEFMQGLRFVQGCLSFHQSAWFSRSQGNRECGVCVSLLLDEGVPSASLQSMSIRLSVLERCVEHTWNHPTNFSRGRKNSGLTEASLSGPRASPPPRQGLPELRRHVPRQSLGIKAYAHQQHFALLPQQEQGYYKPQDAFTCFSGFARCDWRTSKPCPASTRRPRQCFRESNTVVEAV